MALRFTTTQVGFALQHAGFSHLHNYNKPTMPVASLRQDTLHDHASQLSLSNTWQCQGLHFMRNCWFLSINHLPYGSACPFANTHLPVK